jgi:hypothetical protein
MNKRLYFYYTTTTATQQMVRWLVGWVRGCKSGTKGMIQLNNKYSTVIFYLFFFPVSLSLRSQATTDHDYEFHEIFFEK